MSADSSVPIRILSVDDHPILRQGVAALVGGQADMSVVAARGDPAIPSAPSGRYADGLANARDEWAGCDYCDSRGIS